MESGLEIERFTQSFMPVTVGCGDSVDDTLANAWPSSRYNLSGSGTTASLPHGTLVANWRKHYAHQKKHEPEPVILESRLGHIIEDKDRPPG
jgi:hypothetical protein